MERHRTSIFPHHSATSDCPGCRYGKEQLTCEGVRHGSFKAESTYFPAHKTHRDFFR